MPQKPLKQLFAMFLTLMLVIACSACEKSIKLESGVISILDKDGKTIAAYSDSSALLVPIEKGFSSYSDFAENEAFSVLSEKYGIKDIKQLDKYDLKIKTNFDKTAYNGLVSGNEIINDSNCTAGLSITDLDGKLLACYSKSCNDGAVKKAKAGSSFKPLGVYAPAIDDGIVNWSTPVADEPITNATDKFGKTVPWPANYSNTYSYQNISVCEAVTQSINTVAAKVLKILTVKKSCEFIEKLDIDTSYEKEKIKAVGQNEILANLALGYIDCGVSSVDMAGYYQMFANGGYYTKPYAVAEIVSGDKTIYKASPEKKQIINPSTAKIMNEMLKTVVNGGTGSSTVKPFTKIGGKTGTTDGYLENWFVGFSPEYSCAVRYGFESEVKNRKSNKAINAFNTVINRVTVDKNKDFPKCDDVSECKYCTLSGKIAGNNCKNTANGFYDKSKLPETCDMHRG